jgi:hypothetical protein
MSYVLEWLGRFLWLHEVYLIVEPPGYDLLFLTLTGLRNRLVLDTRNDLHKGEALEENKQWL